MLFHLAGDVAQVLINQGHGASQLADGEASADAGDDVFALAFIRYSPKEDMLAVRGYA